MALHAFQWEAPKADLRHYSIIIERERGDFDVVFLPDSGPGEKFLAGGQTKYGAEIHYIISHRTFTLMRKHFAR